MTCLFEPKSLLPDYRIELKKKYGFYWTLHVFQEQGYRSWTLFVANQIVCVACGVFYEDKLEVFERKIGTGIPPVSKGLLRLVEETIRKLP